MSATPFTSAGFQVPAFNCPSCGAYASQSWSMLMKQHPNIDFLSDWYTAQCARCNEHSMWRYGEMVYPDSSSVELPSEDLPQSVKVDYEEAASILRRSPRAAAALLRLAIQKLCAHLGGTGENLNADIAEMVKSGLPAKIQKMLDTVRVIGNHAVHPGEIDLNDSPQTAEALFRLVNIIAEKMITEPNDIDALYETLPENDRMNIAKRDGV